MRNVFLAALAVNIFVFLFYYYLPAEEAVKAPVIPVGTKQLVLLSEVDKAALTHETEQQKLAQSAVQQTVAQKVEKKCFTIGPFKEEKSIADFRLQIKDKVGKTGIRERLEKQHWRYWVYLPAESTRANAVQLASELAKKGLKDYYVIARGESKNSVSLGHFKEKAWAEKRLDAVRKMGYKPVMSAIEKEFTLYWLDYVSKTGAGLSNTELNSFELEESIHQFNRECKK